MTRKEFGELQVDLVKRINEDMQADLSKKLKECDNSTDKMLALYYASQEFTLRYCFAVFEKIVPFDE